MTAIRSLDDFNSRIAAAGNKLVVLDFYANWCGPCKDMDRTVQTMASHYAGHAVIIKVNVDRFESLVAKYNVRCMPTFVFLRNNRRLNSFSGADEHKFQTLMARLTN